MSAQLDLLIPAHLYTDDGIYDFHFNAISWFEQARDPHIRALAKAGWQESNEPAALAKFFDGKHDLMTAVFRYHEQRQIGYECRIDEDAALEWIELHRPQLYEQIQKTIA